MRRASATLGLGALVGCSPSAVFVCSDDAQCDGGRCEASGYCSFPDASCASGWAYGELSAPAVAGRCVDEDDATSTGSAPPSESTSAVAPADSSTGPATTAASTETTANDGACEAFAAAVAMCSYETTGSYEGYLLEYCLAYYETAQGAGSPCLEAFLEYLACISAVDCRALMMGDACADEAAAQVELCPQDAP